MAGYSNMYIQRFGYLLCDIATHQNVWIDVWCLRHLMIIPTMLKWKLERDPSESNFIVPESPSISVYHEPLQQHHAVHI